MFVRFVVLLVSLFVLPSCTKKGPPPPPPPPEVTIVQIQPVDVPFRFTYPGRLEGYRDVDIFARVEGVLLKQFYNEGKQVKKGDRLFLIDPATFQADLKQAEADLAQANARVFQARQSAHRMSALIKTNAVSRKEYDDATSELKTAEAAVLGAQAQVTKAKLDLSYTDIRAPISGIARKAAVSEGSLVSPQRNTLLTSISQLDPIYVSFDASDRQRLEMAAQQQRGHLALPKEDAFLVEIDLGNGKRYAETGKLEFRDVEVDPRTGTINSRAIFPNPRGELLPGQFVNVTVSGGTLKNALTVPSRAVQEGQGGKVVFVVESDNKVGVRPIALGQWFQDTVQITSGLKPGDKVIVDGIVKVRPGVPVRYAAAQPRKTL